MPAAVSHDMVTFINQIKWWMNLNEKNLELNL